MIFGGSSARPSRRREKLIRREVFNPTPRSRPT
jgi:hypothetical protein